ncbi:MAG: hypothetical protein ACRDUB_05585, partial [Mycobacterium sp.]
MITGGVRVLNAGLPLIVDGVPPGDTVQLDWRPPAFGDVAAASAMVDVDTAATHAANRAAIAAVHDVRPQLIRVRSARAEIPALAAGRTLLHAGPPIEIARMCGPMLGALVGAVIHEGWAKDPTQATAMLHGGEIAVAPCHQHGAVGPMAGVIA